MPRPSVCVQSENQIAALRQRLAALLPELVALPGVLGIVLGGGMSRGYADHLSEIDLTLYLTSDAYRRWMGGHAPLPQGIAVLGGALCDIRLADLDAERAAAWSDDALWDASYAEVLHDPQGLVAQLLSAKLATHPRPEDAEGPLFSCWWYFRLAGDIWLHRGDVPQGHHMLGQAVVMLTKALFLANGERVPHEKWLLHMSRSLPWLPARWPERLAAAMATGDMGLAGLRQRQAAIQSLWEEVDAFARGALPVPMMQRTFYRLLLLLAERGALPLAEWQRHADRSLLSSEPFHSLVRVEGDMVALDRDLLRQIGPDAMYAWHYQVVRAVADGC